MTRKPIYSYQQKTYKKVKIIVGTLFYIPLIWLLALCVLAVLLEWMLKLQNYISDSVVNPICASITRRINPTHKEQLARERAEYQAEMNQTIKDIDNHESELMKWR